jgi:Xaa-Pro aminopeptidase
VIDAREARQATLRKRLAADELDGLIVTHPPNVRYLTGFSGSAAILLILPGATILLTDFRYEAQAPAEVGETAHVEIAAADLWDRAAKLLRGTGRATALGFEDDVASVALVRRAREAIPDVELRPAGRTVERLRVRKSAAEVAAIREAARLAGEAFEATVAAVRPGACEREIAARLEYALRSRGSEWHPFPTIVASGPRSALPHAGTASRTIARGDLVVLDFGAQLDGYCADLTRTVVMGRADERQRAMYDLVREAQQRAHEGLRPGMSGTAADALARGVIEARGFGAAFGHSLGHGLGLEVHEDPRVSRSNGDPLPEDAVVTIEPGVYFVGWGGVRLEDDVWLTGAGAELLSDGRTELRELP